MTKNAAQKTPTILFVAPSAYLLGGVQVWLHYLIEGLNRQGFRAICGVVDGDFHCAQTYLNTYDFEHSILISNPTQSQWGRVKAVSDAIESCRADMVLSVNVPTTLQAGAILKQKRMPNLKCVLTLHALEPDYFADIQHMRGQLDAVLVTNRLTELAVKEFTDFPAERVVYAAYGVDLTESRYTQPISQDSFTVVYSGRIENDQKRCADLSLIAQQLDRLLAKDNRKLVLKIAGDGPYRAELEDRLCDVLHNTNSSYEFLGTQSRETLLEHTLPTCDALLITSDWETGPIVAWEAMAAGVAVVCSRYLGVSQERALVDQQNCLLFDVGDTVTAAEALASLQNQRLHKKITKAAHQLVESRYSVQASIKNTAVVLRQVLKMNKRALKPYNPNDDWVVSGRIEGLFGHRLAYYFRRLFGKSAQHTSAGSEWPHTLGTNQLTHNQFRKKLKALDKAVRGESARDDSARAVKTEGGGD